MRHVNLHTPRNGVLVFRVPETQAERERGVNVGLPRPYAGMLFNFGAPVDASMTMAQTPFPLQIAFFGPDGRAHTVYTAPARSGIYRSGKPTRWVVESLWSLYHPGDQLRVRL